MKEMMGKPKMERNIAGLAVVLTIAVIAMTHPVAADLGSLRGLVNFSCNDTLVPNDWNVSVENLNVTYAGEPWTTTTNDALLPVGANYNRAIEYSSLDNWVRVYVHSPDYVYTGVNSSQLHSLPVKHSVPYMNVQVSRAPFVTVTYPNGGENLLIGSPITVNASVNDDLGVTGVYFSYSPDNGSTWYNIGPGQLESGNPTVGIWNVTWDTSVLNNGTGFNYTIKVNVTDNSTDFGGPGYDTDTSDAVFSLIDNTKPLLCNAAATPSTIVVNITNTTLWVDVTDRWGSISDVIVNLTPIGGPWNATMECEGYYIEGVLNWSVRFRADVNVTSEQYIGDHCLQVNASDTWGNYNDTVCIPLKVIKGVQPTNLTVILNLNDTVTIKCNGTEGADYDIYITENYTAGFPGTPNATVKGSPGDIVMWTDENASNYSQRYYKVALTGMPPTNETVGKFNIPAYTDWNLISTPLLLNDTSLSVVIRDAGVGDNIFDYDNVGGIRTSVYVGGDTWIGPVQTFEPEKGYWYQNVGAADFNTTAVGDVPTGNITTMLYHNWNLVGYTSVNTSSVSIVTDAGVGDNIFDYDNVGGIRTSVYVGGDTWIGPVQTFEPGKGYWYQSVVADITWEYTA